MNLLISFAFAATGIFFVYTCEWLHSSNKTLNNAAIYLMICAVVCYIVGHISLNIKMKKIKEEGYSQGIKEALDYQKCLDDYNSKVD